MSARPSSLAQGADRRRVLFVCTHGAVRSPVAQALCEDLFGSEIDSLFAGVHPQETVDPRAVAALADANVSIAARAPQSLVDLEIAGEDLCAFDLIIALSECAREGVSKCLRGGVATVELWPVEDPTLAEDLEVAQAIAQMRDQLAARITERFST